MIKTMQDRQPGLGTTGISGTLTLTKTGTTARTATFPDAAITVAGLEVSNVFTAAQTLSAVLNKMGGGTYSADDSVLLLRRESTAVPNSHAVRDESVWTVASGGGGYGAIDVATSYVGASAFNHLHAFQSRPTYNGSASLVDLVGYWSQEAHTGSGTVTNRRGLWVKDPTGAGAITNNIGVDIESLTRGATLNYALRSIGATASLHNGPLTLGASHTTAGAPVLVMTATIAGDHGFTVRNNSSGTGSYAYFSIRNNSTATALFTSYSSGYTGTGYGVTLANYTALQSFGASNLGLIIGTPGALPIIFGTADTARLTISGTGITTLTSDLVLGVATAASTTAGTLQRETNQDKHYTYANGIGGWLDKCIFSQYATVSQAGIVTDQSLASATARGTRTLPANFFKQGKVLRFRLCGRYTTDAASGNATIQIKLGSTVFRTTGSVALDSSSTALPWEIEGEIVCQTTGGSGTVEGVAVWKHMITGATSNYDAENLAGTAAVTIDTTASQAFDVIWTATDAGTTLTCTCFRLWEVC